MINGGLNWNKWVEMNMQIWVESENMSRIVLETQNIIKIQFKWRCHVYALMVLVVTIVVAEVTNVYMLT